MAEPDHPDNNGSGDGFERITPAPVEPGRGPARRSASNARRSVPAVAVFAALGLLLLIGGGLFVWLSAPAPPSTQPPAGDETTTEVPEAEPEPEAPDADAVLAARDQAQRRADGLAEKRERLAEKSVERWAPTQAEALAAAAASAEEAFGARDYENAAQGYAQALEDADALLERAPRELADAIARGREALSAGDAESAAAAFDLALAIDGDNAEAAAGGERADNLDMVLAHMREGRRHEAEGDLEAARTAFAQARELDDAWQPAAEAVQRVDAALAERRFSRRMSEGLAALDRGDHEAARQAFRAAHEIRPDAEEAADGLARANAGIERAAIEAARERARIAEAEENWSAAVEAYDNILARDRTLTFAQDGRARAAERAALTEKLAYHIANPGRLSDASVRESVAEALEQARAVPDPGPRLRERIDSLERRLAAASQPVPVQLESNNRASVTVYRVGRLGRFEQHRLELTPGEYTAIGRCDGHRDARLQFTVRADDGTSDPVTIGCGDPL